MTDIEALIERLRCFENWPMMPPNAIEAGKEAVDALESLQAELTEARDNLNFYVSPTVHRLLQDICQRTKLELAEEKRKREEAVHDLESMRSAWLEKDKQCEAAREALITSLKEHDLDLTFEYGGKPKSDSEIEKQADGDIEAKLKQKEKP